MNVATVEFFLSVIAFFSFVMAARTGLTNNLEKKAASKIARDAVFARGER